ncbi:hypothetical protein GCM10017691_63700 [Pseudonocardia petroleophila]
MPYRVTVGPMASGDVVVKDGLTWDTLRASGVETVAGLEMEAATIARTGAGLGKISWLVAKGVMDYADPRKNDNVKQFAARASADVLLQLIATHLPGTAPAMPMTSHEPRPVVDAHSDGGWRRRADVDHDQLFGTQEVLPRIGKALVNPDGDGLISIFGPGGAGKTTLAYEAVKQFAGDGGFTRVAWVSAKLSHLRDLGVIETSRHTRTGWLDMIAEVAEQLDVRVDLHPARLEESLANALQSSIEIARPCLIVIDNLESAPDAQLAVDFLTRSPVLRPHKVVLTTRNSARLIAPTVREFAWHGLDSDAVREFAAYLAADTSGFELDDLDVDELISMSGGIPLLVKVAVRLAVHTSQPLRTVIDQVRNPGGELGSLVGQFLYEQSMTALAASAGVGDDNAIGLMNSFCARPDGESLNLEDFFELSLIADRAQFERARTTAHKLALIRGVDGNRRFTIHPLLRDFVCRG